MKNLEPYRILFPFGFLFGILGVLIWPLFYGAALPFYPGVLHAALMMGGFEFCFVVGFLMTAAPRFTGTEKATPVEITLGFVLAAAMAISAFVSLAVPAAQNAFYVFLMLMSFLLSYVFLRRFVTRTFSPPPSFFFVGAGLLSAVFGSASLALATWVQLPSGMALLGRNLLFHGTLLAFVLGVGSRLVTAHLGWMQDPIIQISGIKRARHDRWRDFLKSSFTQSAALSLLFLASFFIEAAGHIIVGRVIRALITSWVATRVWRIHKKPRSKAKLAKLLWLSAWSVSLGVWGYALFPAYSVHFVHLLFIGGFALMTLLIGARVTLSHGGHDLALEQNSKLYFATGVLIVLAALTRAAAAFSAAHSTSFILAAAALWLLAFAFWGVLFLRRLFFHKH